MKHECIQNILTRRFAAAITSVTGMAPESVDAQVRPAGDPQFGDYQCNAAMGLARALKSKPRDIAQRIKDAVESELAGIAEPLEIAGPGFINIRLQPDFLAKYLGEIPAPASEREAGASAPRAGTEAYRHQGTKEGIADRLGLPPVESPQRVVVEYSQPNIAKQMHVGHLRSTIIGDVFARVLAFEGHEVLRQNHIGDWGTQFGMLIRYYEEHPLPSPQSCADVLDAVEQDYKAANERFGHDEEFAQEARLAVGRLQSGDPEARRVWERICSASWDAFTQLYQRLGALLCRDDVRGESFYNDRLPGIIKELREKLPSGDNPPPSQGRTGGGSRLTEEGTRLSGEVRDDAGAVVVYLYDKKHQPLFKNADGGPLGMIVQKSDGAYLYATTDLAAIRFRLQELPFPSGGVGAQRIIYVTDARQKLHFQMFFACARAAGWLTSAHQVDHVTFGAVLGEDRRPLKTRVGGTIKLRELLDEAEKRALKLLQDRQASAAARRLEEESEEAIPTFSGDEMHAIARRVGIAAVKYADLRNDRNTDYVFSWDKMLALTGNTAPYMMYAYARIRSIYRKAAERFGKPDVYAPSVVLPIAHPAERALALCLSRFREAIDAVAVDLTPHVLCTYLYDLAADFMRFYESCPVLAAPDEAARHGRMRLCDLTARTLRLGLWLLGVEVIERM